MHIGVPTGGQRQPQVVSQPRAQHPHLAGSGDVNQIRLELLQHLAYKRYVAQERKIEAQILFESKREKAARKLQRPDVAVLSDDRRARPGANAKKRQILPPRKGLKMAAGVRHPIHFMERVGKVSYTRRSSVHRLNRYPERV